MTTLLRYADWTRPVTPVRRAVTSVGSESGPDRPPVLFVSGPGWGSWAFAEHWLAHTAARGFDAHALQPRADGDLRAHVHDVVQTAAALPRQAVLAGHGTGALIVAHALTRYPARAAVLAAPLLDNRAALLAGLRANPAGTLPVLVGGRRRLNAGQVAGPGITGPRAEAYTKKMAGEKLLRGPRPGRPAGNPPVLVAGSPDDRVVPRAALDAAAKGYRVAPLLFPGMGHALMLESGWAEPLDAMLDWLVKELG